MGSASDWETMRHAAETLDALGVAHEVKVVSAHRTPERLYEYARTAKDRGLKMIIAGAGGAAHLPGMAASMTGPAGARRAGRIQGAGREWIACCRSSRCPPACRSGRWRSASAGAINAALLAASILALSDEALAGRLEAYRAAQTEAVPEPPE